MLKKIWEWKEGKRFWKQSRFWIIAGAVFVIGLAAGPFVPESDFDFSKFFNTDKVERQQIEKAQVEDEVANVKVPDLIGKNAKEACDILAEGNLRCEVESNNGKAVISRKNWTVESQEPSANETVTEGDKVKLVVSKPDNTPDEVDESKAAENKHYSLSEDLAEVVCQEESIIKLQGLGRLKDISVIALSNYNKTYTEQGGGYDMNGNVINLLTWNGKYKSTGDGIRFACYISSSSTKSEDMYIHNISMNGTDIVGTKSFTSYDANGNIQQ